MSKVMIISSDCHAGALPHIYNDYLPEKYRNDADQWWVQYAKEMVVRAGTFFDQEMVDEFKAESGEAGVGRYDAGNMSQLASMSDKQFLDMLNDETNPFAPRQGEYDTKIRIQELDDDGVAGEVVFPQMAPFGAGLMQYRNEISEDQNLAGVQAYNRWLADLCSANPGRHAGVALINVDNIDVTVEEIKWAKQANMFGGVLLPTSTGHHPFYHHPRYEPIWDICEKLDMPIHTHSGWSPDYGDVESATAMYISEVDMWAQRPFKALLWSGAFERHPNLKMVFTETGCAWILEMIRVLSFKADNPLFAHWKKGITKSPMEYFQQNCHIGASFLPRHEVGYRYDIGLDKLMWGSDYPHMEGTWPNTMDSLRDTFAEVPEAEIHQMMGENAAKLFGFDVAQMRQLAERIGPEINAIKMHAA
ncbi:MAG: amidohydrolase family protein [Pseudomonadales bacterium]